MGKKRKLPPGTWVERNLMRSKAFLSLRGCAPQLLVLFLAKRTRKTVTDKKGANSYDWTNLNNLRMTYAELESLGITKPRATRGIDELLAKGFIEVRHQGGGYKQDCSVYALTDTWTYWTPGMIFSQRKQDVKRGYQGHKKTAKVLPLRVGV